MKRLRPPTAATGATPIPRGPPGADLLLLLPPDCYDSAGHMFSSLSPLFTAPTFPRACLRRGRARRLAGWLAWPRS